MVGQVTGGMQSFDVTEVSLYQQTPLLIEFFRKTFDFQAADPKGFKNL